METIELFTTVYTALAVMGGLALILTPFVGQKQ